MTRIIWATLSGAIVLTALVGFSSCSDTHKEVDEAMVEGLFEQGQYDFAIQQATKILTSDPDNLNMLALRGRAFMNINDHASAVQDIRGLIQRTSDSTLLCFVGECYLAMGQLDSAISAFRGAYSYIACEQCSTLGLAAGYYQMGVLDSSFKYANECLAVDSTNATALEIIHHESSFPRADSVR